MAVVAVVGLGYVGLPLVVEFGKLGRTIDFDIAIDNVAKCRAGTQCGVPPRPSTVRAVCRPGVSDLMPRPR